jgi:hypothetical protein
MAPNLTADGRKCGLFLNYLLKKPKSLICAIDTKPLLELFADKTEFAVVDPSVGLDDHGGQHE